MRTLILFLIFFSFSALASEPEKNNGQPLYHVHTPEGGVKKQSGPIKVVNVQLLTHESILEKNIKTEDLVEFMKSLEQAVKSSYLQNEKGELLVKIQLVKDSEFGFRFQTRGDLTNAFLQRVSDNIVKLKNLTPLNDSVSFQVHYTIGVSGV
ncbi:hypothetical protein [Thalassomonas sp. RHCl1]|uniref:hypothetical protein n=1 Tax=Thalassomonas sp. RHCl1 TaxID=2995320 RepID=UPI00248B6EA8|nr:hypothetical protein [Thalassomonas sp. RHCl1]